MTFMLPDQMNETTSKNKKYSFYKTTDSESSEFISELQNKDGNIRFLTIFGIIPSLIILTFLFYKLHEVTEIITEYTKFATIKNDVVNLRDQPTIDHSKILEKAFAGDKLVFIAESKNKWVQVLTANNDTAYIHGKLATINTELVRSETIKRFDDRPYLRYIFLGFAFITLFFWNYFLYHQDKRRKSIFITYELDEKAMNLEKNMLSSFKIFVNSNKKWQILSTKKNYNTKYNAGANVQVSRIEIKAVALHKLPSPVINTNVKIPFLELEDKELYFFPDKLLVKRNKKFDYFQYSSLNIDIVPVSFIEQNDLPSDATVVDYTYTYINKNGDPDKRFVNNPKVPICSYTEYHFTFGNGFNEIIMTSKLNGMDEFSFHLQALSKLQRDQAKESLTNYNVEQSTMIKRGPGQNRNVISREYYDLLVDFSQHLSGIIDKLNNDDSFIKKVKEILIESIPQTFISYCVMYDMTQIFKLLSEGDLKKDTVEMTGLVLLSMKIINSEQDFLSFDYETIAAEHSSGRFEEMADTILEISRNKNPFKIKIINSEDVEIFSSKKVQNNFSLPIVLKQMDHPLFDDYVTTLYRFATIITKADGEITKKEETSLKEIYQLTHNPVLIAENNSISVSNVEEVETLDEVLNQLDSLIGLNEVKKEVKTLINFVQIQKERNKQGLRSSKVSYHCIFTGSPGTGKTTIARLVAKIYKHLGILEKGHLVETDRSGLVAEYQGQTSNKVDKVVKTAIDGILFIDEAYSLVGEGQDDYGNEAVAALIKRMEDNRDKLVLIMAGYTDEMKAFIDTNPGFKSRFNRYIHFPDYTPDELMEIFELFCTNSEYVIAPGAKEKLNGLFNQQYQKKNKSFGNGRLVRNIFEKSIENQSNRIAKLDKLTKELLTTLETNDIPAQ